MRFSNLLFQDTFNKATSKETTFDSRLNQANFFNKDSSGVYNMLSLGQKLVNKIEKLIKDQMDKAGYSEISFSTLQDTNMWDKSGRMKTFGDELFHVDKDYVLQATAEAQFCKLVKEKYHKDNAAIDVYQIGRKFRRELRCKNYLARTREFIMKDGYSLHFDKEVILQKYSDMKAIYQNIFKILGINTVVCEGDVGQIGGDISHEFLYLSNLGEDKIYFDGYYYSLNYDDKTLNQKEIKTLIGLELAHIFNLGQYYTRIFDLKGQGNNNHYYMNSYGIGITRLLMAFLETHFDQYGFIGNKTVNTYDVILTAIDYQKNEKVYHKANEIYGKLKENNIDVILDDRNCSAYQKLVESELIGVNRRVIISSQNFLTAHIEHEITQRQSMIKNKINTENVIGYLLNT